MYRTCGYLGAIGAGAQLKTVFQAGVTDASFGPVRWCVLVGSGVLVVLYGLLLRLNRQAATPAP